MTAWRHSKYFRVVVDADGRHGLWPVSSPPPRGWRPVGFVADRAGCVAYATEAWRDMRPLSVQHRMAGRAPAEESLGGITGGAPGCGPPWEHGPGGRATDAGQIWMAPGVPSTLTELFESTAHRLPGAIAVRAGERCLTYGELADRSDRLAETLAHIGVGAEDRVALHLGGGVDLLVAVVGVLKAGAAYVPIDVRAPLLHRRAVVACSGARLALIRHGWAYRLTDLGCPTLPWQSENARSPLRAAPFPGRVSSRRSFRPVGPCSAACMLFTRELTGMPLGVVVEHGQLLQLALDQALDPLADPEGDSQIAITSAGSITVELWRAVASGAQLVLLPTLPHPRDLVRELQRRQVTTMLAPALVIQLIQESDPRAFTPLRTLFSVGPLSPATCRSILAGGFEGRLFTVHGSAETTVAYAAHEVTNAPADLPPSAAVRLGSPLTGCDLYLLDSDLRPVPPGAAGELYVGGTRVSRGYFRNPGLTVTRFLPDPFRTGGRMHATGSRARQLSNGAFEYLGKAGTAA